MIQIQVDQEAIEKMYMDAIKLKIQELDKELVFWDTKELKRRTCLSWNTIQDNFFHHKDFPKVKIGGKWMYPAKETEEFLETWLDEKRRLQ
ncbi:group-specific protein [Psychrobacillus psychrodurans]|uniref:group-specific protein n=1 Tax=Psychrobacillus psychrodurans TaxID=126157 RepID=UPI003CFD6A21